MRRCSDGVMGRETALYEDTRLTSCNLPILINFFSSRSDPQLTLCHLRPEANEIPSFP